MKQNLIRAVDLIGTALHTDHLKRLYSFSKKTELLNHMMMYMKAESTRDLSNDTRSLAMKACATLVYPSKYGPLPFHVCLDNNYNNNLGG